MATLQGRWFDGKAERPQPWVERSRVAESLSSAFMWLREPFSKPQVFLKILNWRRSKFFPLFLLLILHVLTSAAVNTPYNLSCQLELFSLANEVIYSLWFISTQIRAGRYQYGDIQM